MFDIGFWELSLIAVVALLVIGPERLPGVARTVGKWVGTARRFVNTVQNDIHTEISKADELKRLLEEQTQLKSMHEILEIETPAENERKPVPRAKNASTDKTISSETKESETGEPGVVENLAPDNKLKND